MNGQNQHTNSQKKKITQFNSNKANESEILYNTEKREKSERERKSLNEFKSKLELRATFEFFGPIWISFVFGPFFEHYFK